MERESGERESGADRGGRPDGRLVDELAWCLSEFVDGTVGTSTLERSRRALGIWVSMVTVVHPEPVRAPSGNGSLS